MSDPEKNLSEPADVRTIRHLMKLMHRFGLSELDLRNGRTIIRLRRHTAAATAATIPNEPAPAPPLAPIQQTPAQPPIAKPEKEPTYVRSPMVGTFYESPAPDASPYVAVGSTVRPDTIVCLIEAMKVFTEINSGVSGTITEVLVKSGQAVEYDQPLFRVNPA